MAQEDFKRLHTELSEGRVSLGEGLRNVVALLSGEPVARYETEEDPDYPRKQEERAAKARDRATRAREEEARKTQA